LVRARYPLFTRTLPWYFTHRLPLALALSPALSRFFPLSLETPARVPPVERPLPRLHFVLPTTRSSHSLRRPRPSSAVWLTSFSAFFCLSFFCFLPLNSYHLALLTRFFDIIYLPLSFVLFLSMAVAVCVSGSGFRLFFWHTAAPFNGFFEDQPSLLRRTLTFDFSLLSPCCRTPPMSESYGWFASAFLCFSRTEDPLRPPAGDGIRPASFPPPSGPFLEAKRSTPCSDLIPRVGCVFSAPEGYGIPIKWGDTYASPFPLAASFQP